MLLWYGLLFAVGVVFIWGATAWGVGVRVDSLAYLTSAEALSQGKCMCWMGSGGQLKPLVHFPPLYPSLVAGVSLLGLSIREAARAVDAGLYAANLVFWGLAVHLLTRRFWAGVLVSITLMASPILLRVHDAAMSEPLFLLFTLLGLSALAAYLNAGRRGLLFLAALATSGALLTRYAASSVVVTSGLAILFLGIGPFRQRIRDAAVFGVGSLLPLGLWMVRNYLEAGSATNRVLRFHPVGPGEARLLLDTIRAWFTPLAVSHWIEGAALILILAGAASLLWRARRRARAGQGATAEMGLVFLLFAITYPVVIAVSRSFFDDTIPIDDRMMAPTFMAMVAVAGCAAAIISQFRRTRWVWIALAVLFSLGPLQHMLNQSRLLYERLHTEGQGYASAAWGRSGSVSWVRALPPDAVLYSNKALPLQFLTHHRAVQVPEGYDAVKAEPRTDYLDNLSRMQSALQEPGSYLLMFDPLRPIDPNSIAEDFTNGLIPILTTNDGIVFARPPADAAP